MVESPSILTTWSDTVPSGSTHGCTTSPSRVLTGNHACAHLSSRSMVALAATIAWTQSLELHGECILDQTAHATPGGCLIEPSRRPVPVPNWKPSATLLVSSKA